MSIQNVIDELNELVVTARKKASEHGALSIEYAERTDDLEASVEVFSNEI